VVYLIEDDESVRKALQRLLRSASIETRVFASAEEFLQGGEIDQGACLIMDAQMKGLTGFELQEELRSKKIRLPTIVISALDDAETANARGNSEQRRFSGNRSTAKPSLIRFTGPWGIPINHLVPRILDSE
jgi:DNA-binding NtrC family response regulator